MQETFTVHEPSEVIGFPGVQRTGCRISYTPHFSNQLLVQLNGSIVPVDILNYGMKVDPKHSYAFFRDDTVGDHLLGQGHRAKCGIYARQRVQDIKPKDELLWHITDYSLIHGDTFTFIYEPDAENIPYVKVIDQMPPVVRRMVELYTELKRRNHSFLRYPNGLQTQRLQLTADQMAIRIIRGCAAGHETPYELSFSGTPEGILFGRETAEMFREGIVSFLYLMNYMNHLMAVREFEENAYEEMLTAIHEIVNDPTFEHGLSMRARARFEIMRRNITLLAVRKAILDEQRNQGDNNPV